MNTETYEIEKHDTDTTSSRVGANATFSLQRFTDACLSTLTDLKERVSRQLSAEFGASVNSRLLQQAVHEADALAATTSFPGLFFPTLAEEKVRFAYAWSNKQKFIRERSFAFSA